MENPSARKPEQVGTAIAASGDELHPLPPHSPDLNPIDTAFSKLESLLNKAAARTNR
jgi:transposase